MEDKSLEFLTEEELALHKEFHCCKTEEELNKFIEKVEILNESHENNEIPHLDMTLEEFCEKYNCTKLDDIMKRYGF